MALAATPDARLVAARLGASGVRPGAPCLSRAATGLPRGAACSGLHLRYVPAPTPEPGEAGRRRLATPSLVSGITAAGAVRVHAGRSADVVAQPRVHAARAARAPLARGKQTLARRAPRVSCVRAAPTIAGGLAWCRAAAVGGLSQREGSTPGIIRCRGRGRPRPTQEQCRAFAPGGAAKAGLLSGTAAAAVAAVEALVPQAREPVLWLCGACRNALGARRIRLPQRLPARLARPPVVRPVRILLDLRRAGLRALQGARQLRRRGGRRRQAAGPRVRGVAESLTLADSASMEVEHGVEGQTTPPAVCALQEEAFHHHYQQQHQWPAQHCVASPQPQFPAASYQQALSRGRGDGLTARTRAGWTR
ncbi:unnamed protein product [Miscanthus lutarioriparius]|uniref:Uncharacterized protein n=1 Tax=Miscanthus lutarioriparius TaxID=422564 RepID=A0A811QAZ0_9POAL|nr:unnamed protein product [Miscanthus lutarioriparius]